MNDITVAALPIDITPANPEANLDAMRRALDALPPAVDIAVLPELFTSGFIPDKNAIQACAQPLDGPAINTITQEAAARNTAIAGSLAITHTDGTIRNRAFIILPDKTAAYYDKHHLFSLSDEAAIFTPGQDPSPIIQHRGWRIAMAICYDLRFPLWTRNKPLDDATLAYDLLLIPASWPQARAHAWQTLLQARAIENQACVVGANRSGADPFGQYTDLTYTIDHLGNDISAKHPSGAITATYSREKLLKYRRHFPVWRDSDKFTIQPKK